MPSAATMTDEHEARSPMGGELTEREARQWAVGAHLAGLSWLVSIPGVIGVLVVWLIKKDAHPLIDAHGTEALNFQLSLFIWGLIAVALAFTIIGLVVAIPLFLVVWILGIVMPIVAAVKTSNGEDYRYPMTFRLIG